MEKKSLLSLLFLIGFSFRADGNQMVHLGKIFISQSFGHLEDFGFANVKVVSREEEALSIYSSLEEILEKQTGIDLKTRGKFGIQDDLYIRGMGFERNLVMIDGISVNDPQTGHFNLDLPFTIYDWQKIEILRGPASSIYGSNALGGVINLVSLIPKKDGFKFRTIYGQKQLSISNFSWTKVTDPLDFHLSWEQKSSSGYRPETDFKTQVYFSKWIFKKIIGRPDIILGLSEKDFGADSFYSSNYPREEENTKTILSILGMKFSRFNFSFNPRFYYRRHYDRFILDRFDPDWYKNIHKNHTWGVKLPFSYEFKSYKLNFGSELAREDVESTNLGKHLRSKFSLYFSVSKPYSKKLYSSLSLRTDKYSGKDIEFSPSFYFSYKFSPQTNFYFSLQRGFRVPSFTELYYSSPANKGNPDLTPETAINFEIGLKREREKFSYGLSLFRRFGYDMIDWAKDEPLSPWEARNVSYLKTDGVEFFFEFERGRFSYSHLDTDYKSSSTYSKYIANYLEHKFAFSKNIKFRTISLSFDLDYQERPHRSGFLNLNLGIEKIFNFKNYHGNIFIRISNLTNSKQEEIEGVILPGRIISGGVEFKF